MMSGPGKLWVGIEEGAPSPSSHQPDLLLNSDSNINMWRENPSQQAWSTTDMSHGPLGLPRRGYSPGSLDPRHSAGALDPRHAAGALDPRHGAGSESLVGKMQNIADYVLGASNSKMSGMEGGMLEGGGLDNQMGRLTLSSEDLSNKNRENGSPYDNKGEENGNESEAGGGMYRRGSRQSSPQEKEPTEQDRKEEQGLEQANMGQGFPPMMEGQGSQFQDQPTNQGLDPGGVYSHLSHLGGNPTPDHVFEDQAVYRGLASPAAHLHLLHQQQQQFLAQHQLATQLGYPATPPFVLNAGGGQDPYLLNLAAGQNGMPLLPLQYYAGVPWYPPPGGLIPNGTPTTPGPPQNGSSRSSSGRPGSPASQNGAVTPGPQDSLSSPVTPYQMIPAFYDTHGALRIGFAG